MHPLDCSGDAPLCLRHGIRDSKGKRTLNSSRARTQGPSKPRPGSRHRNKQSDKARARARVEKYAGAVQHSGCASLHLTPAHLRAARATAAIHTTCSRKQCGKQFEVSVGEKYWLKEQGLKMPKKCPECRRGGSTAAKRAETAKKRRGARISISVKSAQTTVASSTITPTTTSAATGTVAPLGQVVKSGSVAERPKAGAGFSARSGSTGTTKARAGFSACSGSTASTACTSLAKVMVEQMTEHTAKAAKATTQSEVQVAKEDIVYSSGITLAEWFPQQLA